jgi:hypothetical protein
MPNQEQARRFEDFARMRLEGRSDITYRAYDLLTKDRPEGNILIYLKAAGQYIPRGRTHEAVTVLQHRFVTWGFPELTAGQIESLLHEFWVYNRIKNGGKKNWPYRDPDEARRLYAIEEATLKAKSTQ